MGERYFGFRVDVIVRRKVQIPIARDAELARLEDSEVSCGQFEDATKHGLRIRHPEEREKLVQRLGIELSPDARHFQQRLDLGGERHLASAIPIIKRFHTKVIPRKEQDRNSGTCVADRKREHSIQALDALRTFLLVKMQHHFSVGIREEAVTLGQQFTTQFSEVIYFAVVGDDDGAVLICHWHVAAG